MNKTILTALLITSLNACADTNFPSDHSELKSGHTWKAEIAHASGYPNINCRSAESGQHSQCWIALNEGREIPQGAKTVKLKIKTKAWVPKQSFQHNAYCLVYAYALKNSTEHTNHFAHTEIRSSEVTGASKRDVDFDNIEIPVINGKVSLGIGKHIKGYCEVDLAIYLDGYTM